MSHIISIYGPPPEELLDLGGVPDPGPRGEAEDGDQPVRVAADPRDLVQTPRPAEDAQRAGLELQRLRDVARAVHDPRDGAVQRRVLLALHADGPRVPDRAPQFWHIISNVEAVVATFER